MPGFWARRSHEAHQCREFESVTKTYPGPHGPLVAVDDLSLAVDQGGIVSLLGPNGAGKTTTLEMLSGLRRPSSGRVRTLGLDPVAERDSLRLRLSVQPQQAALFEHQTVAELLRCWASFYPNHREVADVAARLGLESCVDQRIRRLSGGQQQRVLVALALVSDPELLVLDEPSTGLDPNAREELWAAITPLREAGHSVLLSTHSMEEAEALSDRVVILHQGRVVADGTPDELVARHAPHREVAFDTDDDLDWAPILHFGDLLEERPLADGWRRVRIATVRADELVRELAATRSRRIGVRDGGLVDVFRRVAGADLGADGDAVPSAEPPPDRRALARAGQHREEI
ncbi:MAG: ABC transporter ATP-binding protein [Nocardioides sp.]